MCEAYTACIRVDDALSAKRQQRRKPGLYSYRDALFTDVDGMNGEHDIVSFLNGY